MMSWCAGDVFLESRQEAEEVATEERDGKLSAPCPTDTVDLTTHHATNQTPKAKTL